MANNYFEFRQFTLYQDKCAMKVSTDGCLFGAWVAEEMKNHYPAAQYALDIGTGTGLLSLILAQKNPLVTIDAIEIDEETAAQAKENIAASRWHDSIHTIEADARSFSFSRKYDLLISNPPFYENELKSANEKKNTAHHGAAMSLAELFVLTQNLLNSDGRFFFLLPYKRKEEILLLLKRHSLFIQQLVLVSPSTRHDPSRIFIEGCLAETAYSTKTISIWDEHQQYTDTVKELLKEYYLFI